MSEHIILQNPVLTKFIYPFLLIFFIVFAILEKSKLFGEDKKQVNAGIAFVIGLIFVSAVFPKMVVGNLILFLTIAIIVVFVVMILWGFIMGDKGIDIFGNAPNGIKWVIGLVIIAVVALAVLWATGVGFGIFDKIFGPETKNFWTNTLFILVIAAALAVVLWNKSGKSG